MNCLISMNYHMFNEYDSEKLVEVISNLDIDKEIKGAELYIFLMNEEEKKYCRKLFKILTEKNWILQVHSIDLYNLSKEEIINCLNEYNYLASIYNKKLKFTIHPAEEKTFEKSIEKTVQILNFLQKYVNENKLNLEILIENLNEYSGKQRCNVYDIYKIFDQTDLGGITLDLGHFVYDYSNDFSKLNDRYNNKIKNIHLHDICNRKDHYPFYYNIVNLEKVFKYLNKINYQENIVLEYGVEYLNGNSFEEKIKEYIKQIKYINDGIKAYNCK